MTDRRRLPRALPLALACGLPLAAAWISGCDPVEGYEGGVFQAFPDGVTDQADVPGGAGTGSSSGTGMALPEPDEFGAGGGDATPPAAPVVVDTGAPPAVTTGPPAGDAAPGDGGVDAAGVPLPEPALAAGDRAGTGADPAIADGGTALAGVTAGAIPTTPGAIDPATGLPLDGTTPLTGADATPAVSAAGVAPPADGTAVAVQPLQLLQQTDPAAPATTPAAPPAPTTPGTGAAAIAAPPADPAAPAAAGLPAPTPSPAADVPYAVGTVCGENALLVSADLAEIRLIAAIPEAKPARAIVRMPSGHERVLRVGDMLGESGAKVLQIGPGFLKLAELTVDERGETALVTHILHQAR